MSNLSFGNPLINAFYGLIRSSLHYKQSNRTFLISPQHDGIQILRGIKAKVCSLPMCAPFSWQPFIINFEIGCDLLMITWLLHAYSIISELALPPTHIKLPCRIEFRGINIFLYLIKYTLEGIILFEQF